MDIESTSDKESCEAVKARITQLNKDIEQHVRENSVLALKELDPKAGPKNPNAPDPDIEQRIAENSIQALIEAQEPNGECTDSGYVGNW